MDHDVQGLIADESLADVPDAFVLASFAPAVLHDEVFVAGLVFGGAVDKHAVVVASLVVVVGDLAFLLGDPLLRGWAVLGFFLDRKSVV